MCSSCFEARTPYRARADSHECDRSRPSRHSATSTCRFAGPEYRLSNSTFEAAQKVRPEHCRSTHRCGRQLRQVVHTGEVCRLSRGVPTAAIGMEDHLFGSTPRMVPGLMSADSTMSGNRGLGGPSVRTNRGRCCGKRWASRPSRLESADAEKHRWRIRPLRRPDRPKGRCSPAVAAPELPAGRRAIYRD